jgi:adenylyltransferase/sulfurtransferase
MVGLVQATEVVKVLLGIGDPLIGRLLTYDALGMRFREVRLRRDPNCPLCGSNPTIKDLSIHEGGEPHLGREMTEGGDQACAVDGNGQPAQAGVPGAKAGG